MKNEIAVTSKANLLLDPQVWAIIREQAGVLVKSGFLPPGINTPEKAIAIMIKGVELGIPPMQAFSHIYIISGKPGMSAELMFSLILRAIPNLTFHYKKRDDTACIIVATRPGGKPEEFSFTMEDAKKAGLLSNQTWSKYPRAMLRSRCISEMARTLFPDLLMGCSYTPEELGAVVSEDGTVIDIKVSPPDAKTLVEPLQNQAHKDEKEDGKISPNDMKFIFMMINQKKNPDAVSSEFRKILQEKYKIERTQDLTKAQYHEVLDWVNSLNFEGQEDDIPFAP